MAIIAFTDTDILEEHVVIECGDIISFMASTDSDTIEKISSDWDCYPLSYGDVLDFMTFIDRDTLEEASIDRIDLVHVILFYVSDSPYKILYR